MARKHIKIFIWRGEKRSVLLELLGTKSCRRRLKWAISLISVELIWAYSGLVGRRRVSRPLSLRLASAIWYSLSRSAVVRTPRIKTLTFFFLAKSTASPEKLSILTEGRSCASSRSISSLRSSVKSSLLAFREVNGNAHIKLIKERGRAPNDIQMPKCGWVKTTCKKRCFHKPYSITLKLCSWNIFE